MNFLQKVTGWPGSPQKDGEKDVSGEQHNSPKTAKSEGGPVEEPTAARALLELGNASKKQKGKKRQSKKKKKSDDEADVENHQQTGDVLPEHDAERPGGAAVGYQGSANVEEAVMRFVGGTLQSDSDKKRRAGFENDLPFDNYISNPGWDKFLNVNEELSGDQPQSQTDYGAIFDATEHPAVSHEQPKKRQRTAYAASSNVDPALEHLDDTHQAFGGHAAHHTDAGLVERAISQVSQLARSVHDGFPGPGHQDAGVVLLQPPGHHHAPTASVRRDRGPQAHDDKRSSWIGDGSEMGGSFTKEEIESLERFRMKFCEKNDMSKEQFCERVWASERKKDNFWDAVASVLPNRTRASVYKHVRRAYHVYHKRGKWSPEEDIQLGELVNEKGAQWKLIGMEMHRMPEDCRDRWRNYVKCGNARHQNKWTPEEEELLQQVVTRMMEEAGPNNVNWTLVSDKMNGTRSRIQCRYKWNKLNKKLGGAANSLRTQSKPAKPEEPKLLPPPTSTGAHRQSEVDDILLPEVPLTRLELATLIEALKNYDSEASVNWDTLAIYEGKNQFSGRDLSSFYVILREHVPTHVTEFSDILSFLELFIRRQPAAGAQLKHHSHKALANVI